jgi:drug/metabolite transporter (DMT)-like permease
VSDGTGRLLRIEHLFMLGFALFGAVGHPLARIVVRDIHPLQLALVSLSTGIGFLLLFMAATGRFHTLLSMSARDIGVSAAIGGIGFFAFQILTFSALARIPASVNALLINTSVVYITILAAVTLREKVAPWRIAGILVALAGVPFVTFNAGFRLDGRIDLVGCLFSIFGAVSFAAYSVFGKKLLERNDPLAVTAAAMLSGTILMAVLVSVSTGYRAVFSAPSRVWLLALTIGVTMNGLAYPLWFLSLRRLPASHISVYVYLTPLFAVALSYLILRETFGWLFWLGGALILTGIVLSDLPARRWRAGAAASAR